VPVSSLAQTDPEPIGVLTVVIPYRNQPERLARTVEAFRAQRVPVRFVVVDNDSDRPPPPLAAGAGSRADVEVLPAGANTGFGPAANLGFRHALATDPPDSAAGTAGRWIALAPHDALPAPGCLPALLEAADARPRAGLVCADVGDGHVPVFDPYFGGITAPATVSEGWEDAGYPHGTLLLARRAMLVEVGLFDERYFAYCEETDLALRAAAAGWCSGLVHGARVVNPYLAGALPVVSYLQLRNTLLLVRDHSGRYHAGIRTALALLQLANGLLRPARRDVYFHARGRSRAIVDFLRGHFGPPPPSLTGQA
jgi:N-acetylglucosaminyl-diphospho-decaprenol L-rhamnosyltransferase